MYIETPDRKRTMTKRLSDFKIENRKPRSAMAGQLLSIPFDNNEATKRSSIIIYFFRPLSFVLCMAQFLLYYAKVDSKRFEMEFF